MNININHYLKYITPLLTSIFIAYFISTLLFFILPKKGVDYILHTTDKMKKQELLNRAASTTNSIKNKLSIKAIYKNTNANSWIVLHNKRTGKTIYLKEGDKFEEATLSTVNKHNVVFTINDEKFTLKLDIKKTDIQSIINNGDNK